MMINNRWKSWIGTFLTAMLLVGGYAGEPPLVHAQTQKVRELQRKNSSLKNQRAELRRKRMDKLKKAQQYNYSVIQNQRRMEQEQRDLQFQEQQLENTKKKLVFLDARLDQTIGESARLTTEAGKRLKNLYMGERLSMLQMVLEANDISMLLDRIYYKKRIVSHDRTLLEELKKKVVELNQLKTQLANQKELLGRTVHNIRARKVEISRSIELDRQLRDRYRNDAAFYARAENELLAESSRITQQLRGLSGGTKVAGSTGSFVWPVNGSISSNYGYRVHPIHRTRKLHTGLDIAGPNGAPIKAADGGRVIYAGWKGGYGKTVMIQHASRGGRSLVTLYGHMSSINVRSGQNVSKGQVVGREGSTGYSTGPHLHFEVRVNGAPVDPRGYL